jgi:hypothetical protein
MRVLSGESRGLRAVESQGRESRVRGKSGRESGASREWGWESGVRVSGELGVRCKSNPRLPLDLPSNSQLVSDLRLPPRLRTPPGPSTPTPTPDLPRTPGPSPPGLPTCPWTFDSRPILDLSLNSRLLIRPQTLNSHWTLARTPNPRLPSPKKFPKSYPTSLVVEVEMEPFVAF